MNRGANIGEIFYQKTSAILANSAILGPFDLEAYLAGSFLANCVVKKKFGDIGPTRVENFAVYFILIGIMIFNKFLYLPKVSVTFE